MTSSVVQDDHFVQLVHQMRPWPGQDRDISVLLLLCLSRTLAMSLPAADERSVLWSQWLDHVALPSFVGITTRPRSSARRLPTVVVVATRTTSPAKCVACATALPSQPSRGDAVKFCRLTTSKCGHFTRFHTADPTVRPLNLYFRLTRWWRLINDAKQYKLLMLSWARTNEIVCARQIIAKCP